MDAEVQITRAYAQACEAIKSTLINNVLEANRKGLIELDDDNLRRLTAIIQQSIDQGSRNAVRAIQSAIKTALPKS